MMYRVTPHCQFCLLFIRGISAMLSKESSNNLEAACLLLLLLHLAVLSSYKDKATKSLTVIAADGPCQLAQVAICQVIDEAVHMHLLALSPGPCNHRRCGYVEHLAQHIKLTQPAARDSTDHSSTARQWLYRMVHSLHRQRQKAWEEAWEGFD
jgi:hypothetical protein